MLGDGDDDDVNDELEGDGNVTIDSSFSVASGTDKRLRVSFLRERQSNSGTKLRWPCRIGSLIRSKMNADVGNVG